jgi:hypothetical protein
MEHLYIIEKLGRVIYSKIKKVEEVENEDTDLKVKKYRDFDGEIQYAYFNKVFCYETEEEARSKIAHLNYQSREEEEEIKIHQEFEEKMNLLNKKYLDVEVVIESQSQQNMQ